MGTLARLFLLGEKSPMILKLCVAGWLDMYAHGCLIFEWQKTSWTLQFLL